MIYSGKCLISAVTALGCTGSLYAGGFRLLNQDAEAFALGKRLHHYR
jgi:hypothetical protein